MRAAGVLLAAVVLLRTLDRLLIWCELRGWILYRLSPRPVRSSIGNALLSLDALLQPSRRHVIEMKQQQELTRTQDDQGTGRKDGTRTPKTEPTRHADGASPDVGRTQRGSGGEPRADSRL